jgi:hypothetical protein
MNLENSRELISQNITSNPISSISFIEFSILTREEIIRLSEIIMIEESTTFIDNNSNYNNENYDKYLYEFPNQILNEEISINVFCSICHDDLKNIKLAKCQLSCKHNFHKTCISKWFKIKLSCPCCRSVPYPFIV